MKLKLDEKHTLVSDPMCYWIEETVTPKEEKRKPYQRRVSGYTATFSAAVNSFIEKKIKSSETELISQLAEQIEELKAEVRSWNVK